MKQLPKRHRKSAIFLLEEAVHVLRQAPLLLLSSYYIGALPFMLGLFYFWADMSQSVDARSTHVGASLGLVLLYIWMKCCHAVFAAHVKTVISGKPLPRWSAQRGLSLVATQTLIVFDSALQANMHILSLDLFGYFPGHQVQVQPRSGRDARHLFAAPFAKKIPWL
ncbi:MAG: hypothetical protein P8185_21565 [Deltaproteobacteria bacterium]